MVMGVSAVRDDEAVETYIVYGRGHVVEGREGVGNREGGVGARGRGEGDGSWTRDD